MNVVGMKHKLPDGWKVVKLSTLCDLQNGYAFQSTDYVEISNTLSCRMSNIRPDGVFCLDYNSKFLPDSYADKYSKFLLKDGDVIIAMTDMATEPKILGVPTVVLTNGKNVLLNQRVGKLVIKNIKLLHFPYLKYALSREEVKKYYMKFAGGGVQINLGKNDLLSISIPLPPLEEQHRIAAILDKADAILSKRFEAIRLTGKLLRAAFLDMFGNPVTNPKGWEVRRLDEVAAIQSGVTKGRKLDQSRIVSVPYMRVANVQDGYLDLNEVKEIEVLSTEVEKYTLKKGDLLLTEGGDPDKLGRGSVWYEQIPICIHQNHIFRVRSNQALVEPEFLSILIGSERGKKYFLRAAKQTTGIATINTTQLRAFPALLPPLSLQKEYINLVEKQRFMLNHANSHFREINNLFNSLLHRAFRGEL